MMDATMNEFVLTFSPVGGVTPHTLNKFVSSGSTCLCITKGDDPISDLNCNFEINSEEENLSVEEKNCAEVNTSSNTSRKTNAFGIPFCVDIPFHLFCDPNFPVGIPFYVTIPETVLNGLNLTDVK
jgi:hypothetical protein